MNFNKEKGPKRKPLENRFEKTIEKLKELIDLLSDADFRNKFPEFVNKYQITIEKAEKIRALNATTLDAEPTLRESLESLLEEAREIRRNIHPEDRDTINSAIQIIERSLNALNN